MRHPLCLLLVITCLFLFSCGNADVKPEPSSNPAPASQSAAPLVQTDTFPSGKILNHVTCALNPAYSYALYLPKMSRKGKKYPVLFLFDPHASGSLPLIKYSDLADRYGVILACSNNSKNGLDANTIIDITTVFFQDVLQRVPVDMQNIYTGGFSGGARVAIGIALQDNRVKGLIANSAGFDPRQEPLRKSVCFVALVGNEDFNLAELKNTQVALNSAGNLNDLLIFSGKHDWAPVTDMDKAFLLLSLEGVRAKRLDRNDSILNAAYRADEREAEKILKGKGDVLTRAAVCNLMDLYYRELKPVEKYRIELDKIHAETAYRQALAREDEKAHDEQVLQNAYADDFRKKDKNWWTAEVARLQSLNKTTKDKEKATLNKRLLAYLSLVAFMNANTALNQNALPEAEHFLALYRLIDPLNSEWAYLLARLRMMQNNPQDAIGSLDEAVKLGFKDLERVRSQKEFQSLLNDEKFNEVLAKIDAEKG
jgi:hypothetical protein